MAWTVGHISDKFAIAGFPTPRSPFPSPQRSQLIQQITQLMYDLDIWHLVPATHVVHFTRLTLGQHGANRTTVVRHIQPVPNLLAIAINRQGFTRQRIGDDQRNQLLREVIRPVIVRAIARRHRQPIGVMPSTHQMIAGRLARRIRAVWLVRISLGKGRVHRLQRTIHFIGAHMMKAEGRFRLAFQRRPVAARSLQQGECAIDIGTHELARAMNATIHMALGRNMHDGARLVRSQQRIDQRPVTDIALHESVARIALQRSQILQIARVSQLVQIDHRLIARAQPVQNEVTTNEAGPTGYQNAHTHSQKMKLDIRQNPHKPKTAL